MKIKYSLNQAIAVGLFILSILGRSLHLFFISIGMYVLGECLYYLYFKTKK